MQYLGTLIITNISIIVIPCRLELFPIQSLPKSGITGILRHPIRAMTAPPRYSTQLLVGRQLIFCCTAMSPDRIGRLACDFSGWVLQYGNI